ncbi:hypothetical protein ASD76_17050 [Altererythrobacter sp. Root672]|nr:hypothetical protein ASD76_17050 [Altererythrobacter sp. Root672]
MLVEKFDAGELQTITLTSLSTNPRTWTSEASIPGIVEAKDWPVSQVGAGQAEKARAAHICCEVITTAPDVLYIKNHS